MKRVQHIRQTSRPRPRKFFLVDLVASTNALYLLQCVAMRMSYMTIWSHESILQRDLPQKIVDALRRGMPKAQVARTFGVGISSVKRYAAKAQRRELLERGKAPGKPPKMDQRLRKLLEEDLKERPLVTLEERCDYVEEAIGGVSVSCSTMWSAIARIGSTRKKGDPKRHGARRVPEGRLAGYGGRRGRPVQLLRYPGPGPGSDPTVKKAASDS